MPFLSRCIRKVLRPLVKLDKKLELKIEKKEKAKAKPRLEVIDGGIERDNFFSSISVITHAGGGMQGLDYLNSEEAFPFYYQNGNRVFEYDVDKTENGGFILTHGDTDDERVEILDGRFTPLKIEKCLDKILKCKDIKVIFDCKFKSLKEFAIFIRDYIKEEEALNRVVIQVFNEQNVIEVKEVFDFKLLHVCIMNDDYFNVASTCVKHNIGAVSISIKALKERVGQEIFDMNNICTFAYSVNTVNEFKKLKEKKITGVFSDFLFESDVR